MTAGERGHRLPAADRRQPAAWAWPLPAWWWSAPWPWPCTSCSAGSKSAPRAGRTAARRGGAASAPRQRRGAARHGAGPPPVWRAAGGARWRDRAGRAGQRRHASTTPNRCWPAIAAQNYSADYLWRCTLVTTVEPCAMCAGTQYWAHIGRLVYGMSESRLLELTGNHDENPTLDLPCREVFARGQKAVEVIGPVPDCRKRDRRAAPQLLGGVRRWTPPDQVRGRLIKPGMTAKFSGAPRPHHGGPATPSICAGSESRAGPSPSSTQSHAGANQPQHPGRWTPGCPCPRA
jgi:hypothetical protein